MKVFDYHCEACDLFFEEMVAADEQVVCGECSQEAKKVPSASRVGLYNDPAKREQILRQRSRDHSFKEMAKEPEKHGFDAAIKPRLWNKRSSKKSP